MAEGEVEARGGTRVLLCGVEPEPGGPLARNLRSNGFPADLAAGGKDALDRVRREDYLVVLTGFRLEGLSGLEFLREAKRLRPGVLVVMIAEKVELEDAVDSIRQGAWDFLRAPVDPEDLLAVVRRSSEVRRLEGASDAALRRMLKSQYRAALAMLREAVERCPDALWDDPAHTNRTWQIAYHALFFARYYGGRDESFDGFWAGHRRGTQNPDGIPGPPDPESPLPLLPEPYTKAEVLAAWDHCNAGVEAAVDALDLAAPQCGFPWYPIPKLEHQVVNIRHIQHHAGQISERLRREADIGIAWAGARRR
jgi:DNA-binding response OmpR family regulator